MRHGKRVRARGATLAIALMWAIGPLGCGDEEQSPADSNEESAETAKKKADDSEQAEQASEREAAEEKAKVAKEEAAKTDPDSKFCSVLDVAQSKCQRCHAAKPVAGAPMPLITYEDFIAPGFSNPSRKVYELVRDRVRDEQRPMPPAPAQLSSDALAQLDSWVDNGALKPQADCPKPELDKAARPSDNVTEWPADCEQWYTFAAYDKEDESKSYMVPAKTEEHPTWSFDAPWGDDEVQLLASRPITDNPQVLHHWILWDTKLQASLSGWAPGGIPDKVPNDVGLYLPKGEKSLTLDMHYFNLNGDKAEPDRSGVEICITRTLRPKTAANIGLMGSAVVKAMSRGETPVSCSVAADEEVHLLGINPHMHRLGVHAKLELTRAGKTTVLWDAPFSFMEQEMHPLEDVVLKQGDVLTTTCTYLNDTSKDVAWGDSTNDEMCINWLRYYPDGAFRCNRMSSTSQQ